MEENKKGIIYAPYMIAEPECTYINGEIVWYRNKWKNLWLKIKRIFYKSKNLKNFEKYSNNKIYYKFYSTIEIKKENEI